MYLFALKNGKKKLAYGASPEDALDILAGQYQKINQRQLQQHVKDLG
jgi:hypothetical protein